MEARGVKTVHSDWSNAILVCKKCSKKLGGGFGPRGKTGLAKALRGELSVRKGRKSAVGIIDVACLGVCPRGSVVVVNGAAPEAWRVVRAGTSLAAVAADLGLAPVSEQSATPDDTAMR